MSYNFFPKEKEGLIRIDKLELLIGELVKPEKTIAIGGGALLFKPMEAIREIIRQKVKNLTVYTLIGDMDIDLLMGVNAITHLHSSYVGLPMIGMARNFRRVLEGDSNVKYHEWTELGMVRAFQAGALGTPYVLVRSFLGSDLVSLRDDFVEVEYNSKKYVRVPAINPDLAIVHAYAADPHGNVYCPEDRLLEDFITLPALCSKELLVTVEKLITEEEGRQMTNQILFSYLDVDYIAVTPNGAWPSGFPPFYPTDMSHLMEYSGMATVPETLELYLQEHVRQKEED